MNTALICMIIWAYAAWFDYFKQNNELTALLDAILVIIYIWMMITGEPVSSLLYGLAIVKICLIGMISLLDSRR